MAQAFKFELVSPERLLVSEQVAQVVVPATLGDFTVLSGHAPYMSTIRPGILEVTAVGGKTSRVFVRGGFADVSAAGLTILAEKAIPVEDLKPDEIAREIKDAEEDLADARSEDARRIAEEKLGQLRDVQNALGAVRAAH